MKCSIILILGLLTLITTACSTKQIIRDSEYKYSEAAFKSGDIPQALERFPTKERHGFVTSIEKSWLALWDGEKDNKDLMRQSKTLDERKFTSVTREAKYFFYNESEDGYIPAEHEIIVMHLMNAMYFMRNEKWDEARVEARRATFFLQNYFKEDQSHFDDPALRLWLAGIWASLGEWQDAQVDLRKAYELSKNKALLPLIEMQQPPKNLNVIFDGGGPVITWQEGKLSPEFSDASTPPSTAIKFNTLPWFLRHEERNSEIRSIVMKSNYMAQYYGLNTSVGAEKSLGFAASNGLRAAGVIVGAVIIGGGIYILAQSGASGSGEAAGYIIATGLLASAELWKKGDRLARDFERSTEESKQEGLENLRTYRFVRFMPSWISLTTTDEFVGLQAKSLHFKSPSSKTTVLFLQRF
ncbi:hypothetical protein [Bdellovibrio sp. HCB-110]|uniref:hypothetical protein n=1 Tax=Bdellovibrio sp. HCB-110 TaxID=3391182 RepID=UPI0039B65845